MALVPPPCPHTPLLCPPQISPQIYQSLYFNELAPTNQHDFMMHKVLDEQGWLILLEAHNTSKDLQPGRQTATMPPAIPSPASVFSLSASGSGLQASKLTPPGLRSSLSLQRP